MSSSRQGGQTESITDSRPCRQQGLAPSRRRHDPDPVL